MTKDPSKMLVIATNSIIPAANSSATLSGFHSGSRVNDIPGTSDSMFSGTQENFSKTLATKTANPASLPAFPKPVTSPKPQRTTPLGNGRSVVVPPHMAQDSASQQGGDAVPTKVPIVLPPAPVDTTAIASKSAEDSSPRPSERIDPLQFVAATQVDCSVLSSVADTGNPDSV